MTRKMTLEDLKGHMPTLLHKQYDDGYHSVGYYYLNDNTSIGFLIQGSGFSEIEAWQDAYDWINKSGIYTKTDELQMF